MELPLFRRRTLWFPTLLGWVVLAGLVVAPIVAWWFAGEAFLATTDRKPAEVLVVEGWIGREGLRMAKDEFLRGKYQYLVTSGGFSHNSWDERSWSYALVAHDELVNLGLDASRVIAAPAVDSRTFRTFEAAVAVRQALAARHLRPTAVNVLTVGAHARRSRLVFHKVLGPGVAVGVIAWFPSDLPTGPWWRSSARAEILIKETVGWAYELLLDSGRPSGAGQ